MAVHIRHSFFDHGALSLFHVMFNNPDASWDDLDLAGLYRPNMLLRRREDPVDAGYLYVLDATDYYLHCCVVTMAEVYMEDRLLLLSKREKAWRPARDLLCRPRPAEPGPA